MVRNHAPGMAGYFLGHLMNEVSSSNVDLKLSINVFIILPKKTYRSKGKYLLEYFITLL